MIQLWNWIKSNPNRAMFLVPIILVAGISISHVVTWYDLANPINWAIYLSIAIEIAAMTALVATTSKVKGGIWLMFGLVTFIQLIGNVFFCFKEIDATSPLFKSWLELTSPIWEMMGTDINDTVSMKRWLAFLEGGLLPIISLTSLHFFVNYNKKQTEEENNIDILKKEMREEIMNEISNPYYDKNVEETAVSSSVVNEELDETDYLLSSEKNREHVEESIKQTESTDKIFVSPGVLTSEKDDIVDDVVVEGDPSSVKNTQVDKKEEIDDPISEEESQEEKQIDDPISEEESQEEKQIDEVKKKVINKNIRRTKMMDTLTGKIKRHPKLSKNIKRID